MSLRKRKPSLSRTEIKAIRAAWAADPTPSLARVAETFKTTVALVRKALAMEAKGPRPSLGGRDIFCRVHGLTQAKIERAEKDQGVKAPEVLRRLARAYLA